MRHAASANFSRSASLIRRRLVAQYCDVPSVTRTRNTLISPNPLSQTIVPSPPPNPAAATASNLPVPTRICRFDFSRVKKCQPTERTNFRLSIEAYQLSKQTRAGLKPRSLAVSSISAKWSFLVFPSPLCNQTRGNQLAHTVSRRSTIG